MIIAGIDFETTSVDADTCYPTEFALILWEPEKNQIIEPMSFLISVPDEIEITNEHISGISKSLVNTYGYEWTEVQAYVLQRLVYADYLMAHNKEFDRKILQRQFNWNNELGQKPYNDSAWIDTMTDLPFPDHVKTRSLLHLAAEHGFLNPFPHRALFDVMTMIKLASMYDITEVIRLASSPNIWVRAAVSMDDRQMAKDLNFRWDPENKFWVRQIKEVHLERLEGKAEFPVDLLPGYTYKEQYA